MGARRLTVGRIEMTVYEQLAQSSQLQLVRMRVQMNGFDKLDMCARVLVTFYKLIYTATHDS